MNHIKFNVNHKNLIFKIIFTKKNLIFIKILRKLNFINRFVVIKTKNLYFIKIFAYYYKTNQIGKNFKLLSTPSKTFFISFKALKLLSKRSGASIFLISTTKGIITHQHALKNKIGGIVIGFFSF
jgi:ribosomal protein S8